jgi:hypothetical protein
MQGRIGTECSTKQKIPIVDQGRQDACSQRACMLADAWMVEQNSSKLEDNSRKFYYILASSTTTHIGFIKHRFFCHHSSIWEASTFLFLLSEVYNSTIKHFHLLDVSVSKTTS